MENRFDGFQLSSYSDVPIYNIQAVAASTNVPAITLRSWERRYGMPRPKRDPKGYRLYSERDVEIVRWLRVQVQQGVGISRAVNLLGAIEAGELAPSPPASFSLESLRHRLTEAIAALDAPQIDRVMSEALMVASVEEVSLQILQPVLYDIGELWASGALSVTTEHIGSNLLRAQLQQLMRLTPPPHRQLRILVGCAPGELHDIGALMLALFLRRRGFDAMYAGASVESEGLMRDVRRLGPHAVCLSASSETTVPVLRTLLGDLLTTYGGVVGFGGRIFNERPDLIDRLPGVYLGQNAGDAVACLEGLLFPGVTKGRKGESA